MGNLRHHTLHGLKALGLVTLEGCGLVDDHCVKVPITTGHQLWNVLTIDDGDLVARQDGANAVNFVPSGDTNVQVL